MNKGLFCVLLVIVEPVFSPGRKLAMKHIFTILLLFASLFLFIACGDDAQVNSPSDGDSELLETDVPEGDLDDVVVETDVTESDSDKSGDGEEELATDEEEMIDGDVEEELAAEEEEMIDGDVEEELVAEEEEIIDGDAEEELAAEEEEIIDGDVEEEFAAEEEEMIDGDVEEELVAEEEEMIDGDVEEELAVEEEELIDIDVEEELVAEEEELIDIDAEEDMPAEDEYEIEAEPDVEDEASDVPDTDPDPTVDEEEPVAQKHILFAHGMNSGQGVWDAYAAAAYMQGWAIHRTSVEPMGSIAQRAEELAEYIDDENLDDASLVVVCHSMGGLDVRYLITEGHDSPYSVFGRAARTIKKVYTLATPHKGVALVNWNPDFGSFIPELGVDSMKEFNLDRPYTHHEIGDRFIPMLAMRFTCSGNGNDDDGVVFIDSQSLNGAPHTTAIFVGSHRPDDCNGDMEDVELLQVETILQPILDDQSFSYDIHNVVFYEGNDCEQEEKAIFHSDDLGSRFCNNEFPFYTMSHNQRCDNDEVRSVRIYPSVDPGLRIQVFDFNEWDRWDSFSDDWSEIYIEDELDESICINTFEQDSTTSMENAGVYQYFHQGPSFVIDERLDGKVSRIRFFKTPDDDVIFYEDNYCQQDVAALLPGNEYTVVDCTASSSCVNDEARSVLVMPGVDTETLIRVYDNPDGSYSDDFMYINRGSRNQRMPFCITGFEHDTSSREANAGFATYWRQDNGLNGKVSRISVSKEHAKTLVFYEGLNCGQDVRGIFRAADADEDYNVQCTGLSGNGTCTNDEIVSLLIMPGVRKGKDIRVFDSPDGSHDDDYTSIYRGWQTFDVPFCINGFEHDTSSREEAAGITVYYHPDNGLNGKISRVRIVDEL